MSKLPSVEESELFEDLMRYRETVLCICLGFAKNPWDAEELAQETCLKAYKNISTLKNIATAKGWLFQIAKNTCLDHAKEEKMKDPEEKIVIVILSRIFLSVLDSH